MPGPYEGGTWDVHVELPDGSCPVTLTGWLLEYPLLWSTGGAAEAAVGALDGVPLLLCSATLHLPVRGAGAVGCAGALHRRLPANGIVFSRVVFSLPCAEGYTIAEGQTLRSTDALLLPAAAPPHLRAVLRAWVERTHGSAHATSQPASFDWRIVVSPRVVL